MGHRHWVTVLKIDRIVHEIEEAHISQEQVQLEVLNLRPTVSIV